MRRLKYLILTLTALVLVVPLSAHAAPPATFIQAAIALAHQPFWARMITSRWSLRQIIQNDLGLMIPV